MINLFSALFLALLLIPAHGSADDKAHWPCPNFDAVGISLARYQAVMAELNAAAKRDSADAWVPLLRFPVLVDLSGKSAKIKSSREWKKQFRNIFHAKFKARLKEGITDGGVICRSDELGLAHGGFWLKQGRGGPDDWKVITINNE